MIRVRAHTCYLGNTGYANHARHFFRELSKQVDLRVRNFTWDNDPTYLNETDFRIIDTITLSNNGKHQDYPISHSFPQHPWIAQDPEFVPDIDIVLMDGNHYYFYEEYSAKVTIAFTVWESTLIEEGFFQQLLKFDYLWVATNWHKKVAAAQGYPLHRIFVVNEGVSDEIINSTKQYTRRTDGPFQFMFFGRWDYRKSVPELLAAFTKAFPNGEDVELIISADNPFSVDGMHSTEERFAHYGITDPRIKIKHWLTREEYLEYLNTGNVLLTCARSEGWNIPLMEAMAVGTPVIYSDWGAQLEFAKGTAVKIKEELPASIGAKLGFAGDCPGVYAEPDFDDLVIKIRECYDLYESKLEMAKEEIGDLIIRYSWNSVVDRAMNAIWAVCYDPEIVTRADEASVIMSHADTEEKLDLLRMSVVSLKNQGQCVVVSSHIPVPKEIAEISDYVVIDKENPVIYDHEYSKLGVDTVHFMNYPDFHMTYSFDFNHGYAALKLIKNGAALAHANNYRVCHFVNYDYILVDPEVLWTNSKDLANYSIVGYTWGHDDAINTGLFSTHTETAINLFEKFKQKSDYATHSGGAVLENLVYLEARNAGLTMRMSDIKELSSDNIINAKNAKTRPTLATKNGEESVIHLAKDRHGNTYLFAQGTRDEPLVFNIVTPSGVYPRVVSNHPVSFTYISPEVLAGGFSVNIEDHNLTIEYSQSDKKANCDIKNKHIISYLEKREPMNRKNIHFIDGPFVEILGQLDSKYLVEFIDQKDNSVVFQTVINNNNWARCSRRYYTDWKIRITDLTSGVVDEHVMNLDNARVLISLDSKSLGDTIAWFAHIEEFWKKHNCHLFVSTFKNDLFKGEYPQFTFVEPGESVDRLYASYKIGWFYSGDSWDSQAHPRDFKSLSMQTTTTDILGLPESSQKPRLAITNRHKKSGDNEKYVCIGFHSTAQAKYWNNPTGWQEVVDHLRLTGYKVVGLSLEEDGYMGNHYPKGVDMIAGKRSLEGTIDLLINAEFFIGIGSGLSWLSWAVGIPTVIISGFSLPHTEPLDETVCRIFNPNVCNGCFNRHKLDAGDWNWCPDKKDTNRFECTKAITGKMVIERIDEFTGAYRTNSIERIIHESYKLGMVQNYSEIYNAAEFIKNLEIESFVEIGTDQGGTFAIWSKLAGDGVRISVDIPHGNYGQNGYNVNERDKYLGAIHPKSHFIHGDSHSYETLEKVVKLLDGKKVDFLFIDGDHVYEGVKADYQMYRHIVKPGGWIGFHDIKDTPFHRRANCRVDLLWSELEGNKVEFVDMSSELGGIGLIQV